MPNFISSGVKSSDVLLKTGQALVRSVTVAWKGLAVGDIACTLKDGVNIAASDEIAVIVPTANGTMVLPYGDDPLVFETGLFVNIGPGGDGKVFVTTQFR